MSGNIFLRHPSYAISLALITLLCGVIGMFSLGISQYPAITPVQVNVTVNYPGADAATILETVIEPLEQQINGVPDMLYLTSTANNSGSAVLTVTFAVGTPSGDAVRNVQDRVNWAQSQLPAAVQKENVIVQEQAGNILLAIAVYSPDNVYDALTLSNYAAINIVNELKRIPGIAEINIFGAASYAMRIWLKPEKLAAYKISPEEISAALNNQNMQVSAGSVGGAPNTRHGRYQYTVLTRGRLRTADEFRDIIVRAGSGGRQLKLSDVAAVELGEEFYQTSSQFNGRPAAVVAVYQRVQANGIAISQACRAKMEELRKNFPPGLAYVTEYDSTDFVRDSIDNVIKTLLSAVVLVALVCVLFLQSFRMALVPLLAMPVSLVGTFAILRIAGFSINLFTLFALVLAIGIVVDDAIIVIENIHRLMTEEKLSPAEAAEKSMTQITGAIIATTAVLLAMFVPICFMNGITGELYRQFGITVSAAVLLSAFNALTLSPVLGAMLLRPGDGEKNHGFFGLFNRCFSRLRDKYANAATFAMRHGKISFLLYFALAAIGIGLYVATPQGFIPEEDQGVMFGSIELAPAASLRQNNELTYRIAAMLREVQGVDNITAIPGFNIMNSLPSDNNALIIATFKPWRERLKKGDTQDKILLTANMTAMREPEAFSSFFGLPPIPGIGTAGGFDLVLSQRNSGNPDTLQSTLDKILLEAARTPELRNVFSTFNANKPMLYLNINRAKAMQMGVSLNTLHQTLEGILGSLYINDFNNYSQVYQVEVQGSAASRDCAEKINQLYVTNSAGKRVPLRTLLDISVRNGPNFMQHFNLNLATQIQGSPAPGISLHQAMDAISAITRRNLLPDQQYSWSGISYQADAQGDQPLIIFALALTFIFLFLLALYGSFRLPLAALLTIAPAVTGALLLLWLRKIDNNIYTQLGLVLLFAMAAKTAILIVDFAKQRHDAGEAPVQAARQAALLRFRAVLMTGMAFILGTLPLLTAAGPGAAASQSIGATVVGGMLPGLTGVVLFVPLFFTVMTPPARSKQK